MQNNCNRLSVTDLGSTPVQETTSIDGLNEPVQRLRKVTNAQRRACWLSISSAGIHLEDRNSKESTELFKTKKLTFCCAIRAKAAGAQVNEPLFVFVVRHKKKLQCHAFLCRTDADAKTLADCCSAQMTEQRQQASTREAPKRRLDVREDECANLTPKGFVLIGFSSEFSDC